MINALIQQAPTGIQFWNRSPIRIESLLSARKVDSTNPTTLHRSKSGQQIRKQFHEVLESQNKAEKEQPRRSTSQSAIRESTHRANPAKSWTGLDTTNIPPSSRNQERPASYKESNTKSVLTVHPTQPFGATEPVDERDPIAELKQFDAIATIDNQPPVLVPPISLPTTRTETDPLDGDLMDKVAIPSSISCTPRAESDLGVLEGIASQDPTSKSPGTEAVGQGTTTPLPVANGSPSSRPSGPQSSNGLGEVEPFQTPFSKAALLFANNLDSIFQVRVDVLKPVESANDLFYLRNHLLPSSSAAFSSQNQQEPKPESTKEAASLSVKPAHTNPFSPELNQAATTHQEFPDLETLNEKSQEDGIVEETTRTGQGTFEKVPDLVTVASSLNQTKRSSKEPSTSPVEPVIASEPLSKRNVSQLVLRMGEDKESMLAVRLNMNGEGLRMEVLGGNAGLRDSLRGALPSLERTLERQADEEGWRIRADSPSVGIESIHQASASSRQGETNGTQQEDHPRRSSQGELQHRRKDSKRENFTFTHETGNYK